MKKFLIISCAFLMGISLSLAQTTVAPGDTPAPAKVTTNTTLENIEIRIDRRLINFNRYIAAWDMAGIKSIVSSENKDFYANFLKYIEVAPIFTVKRDTTQDIIKTPLDEYAFPALLSLGGKEAKVSMKFIEEDSETGNKWVIVDSDLHIVWKPLSPSATEKKPVTPPTKGSLTSSVISKDVPATTVPSPNPKDTPVNTQPPLAEEKAGINPATDTTPLTSAAVPSKPTTKPPTIVRPTPKAGLWIGGIIGISLWITLLFGLFGGGYYYFKKRKALWKALLAAQAVSVATAATAISNDALITSSEVPLVTPAVASEIPPAPADSPLSSGVSSSPSALEQMESNVSLVENDSSGTTVQIDTGTSPEQATNSSETTSTIPQNDMQDAAAQNILSAQETSSDTGNTPNGATSETIEEKAADAAREDISILSDTSSEEALPSQASVTSLDAIIGNTGGTPSVSLGKSSEEHLVIDPIFSSPAPVTSLSPDPLFENILSPKPEPSATSSLFGGMA